MPKLMLCIIIEWWVTKSLKKQIGKWLSQMNVPTQFKAFNCSFSSTSYVAWHLSCICIQVTWQWLPHQIVYEKLAVPILNSSFISCDVNTLFWYLIAVQFFPSLFFCKFERRDPVKVWWIQVLSIIY